MFNKYLLLFFLFYLSACASFSFQKIPSEIVFQHTFQGKPFALNMPYVTLLGDTVVFTKFKYYVSNLSLEAGQASYHLISIEDDKQADIHLAYTPQKQNLSTNFSFGIGIDSLRNSKGAQTGVLDPLQGMFWTWEQGYVFLKAEGYYITNRVSFVIHIGRNQHYQMISHAAQMQDKKTKIVVQKVMVQIERLFGGYVGAALDLPLPTKPMSIMAGEKMGLLKKNIRAMFESSR